jgi:hypothetical protein
LTRALLMFASSAARRGRSYLGRADRVPDRRLDSRYWHRDFQAMPTPTRRKSTERNDCWHIFYDGVQVGTIARRAGAPVDCNPWGCSCGFYPGMNPGEHQDGTAATFEAARAEFDEAWQRVVSRLSEDALQEWRDQQAMTAWKYEMHDLGLPLPMQLADGQAQCFCGIEITTRNVHQHILRQHAYEDRS